jgi:adenosylcobinamide-GDP ribazoletransferase
MLGDVRLAFGFLTRLPVGGSALDGPALSRAAVWFPLVGVCVGGLMAGVHAVAGLALDATSATLLALLAAVLATGGFHEDGLADTADAAGAHVSRERRLEILHDSRVGTYGALALIFVVGLSVGALDDVDDLQFLQAATAGHVLGRWSSLPLSWRLRPAAPGSGALLRASGRSVAGGTALAVGVAVAAVGVGAAAVLVVAGSACIAASALFARRMFGGATGDVFGATNKMVELLTYLLLAGLR